MPTINKRLRVMAGPNGSGKSTVIKNIEDKFFCGPFVNADLIERSFYEKRLLNLADFNLNLTKKSFDHFLRKEGVSWTKKAEEANSTVSISFSNNNLVVDDDPNAYDAAIAADYVRHQLLETNLRLLPRLIPLAYRCYLFDNSEQGQKIDLVAEIENGKKLTLYKQDVPWWIEQHVISTLFKPEDL